MVLVGSGYRWVSGTVLSLLPLGLCACTSSIGDVPELSPLEPAAIIRAPSEGPTPYDAVGLADCSILVSLARTPRVIQISASGVRRQLAAPVVPPSNLRFSTGGIGVRWWSSSRRDWGSVTWTAALVAHPTHDSAWNLPLVGPSINVADGVIAVAPFGGRRAEPRPALWATAPSILLITPSIGRGVSMDTLKPLSGTFLSSSRGDIALGSIGDTIFAVDLFDARIDEYVVRQLQPHLIASRQLPRYFRQPSLQEATAELPWLQEGGKFWQFRFVPHIASASFDDAGRLYTVRNYGPVRRSNRGRIFKQPLWEASERGLEVYDRMGRRVAAYRLRTGDAPWVTAGALGRFSFPVSRTEVHMYQLTANARHACRNAPGLIDLGSGTN